MIVALCFSYIALACLMWGFLIASVEGAGGTVFWMGLFWPVTVLLLIGAWLGRAMQ